MNFVTGLIRGTSVALLLMLLAVGAGYGAAGGSQTVSVAAASSIDVNVPATASIASTVPGSCGPTSSTIQVRTNANWNLQIRANASYPNGKPMSGATEMTDVFQYRLTGAVSYNNITTTYANLYGSNQGRTTGWQNVGVDYQQCVEWADAPGTYTIVVEYLGVTF